jgi:hypothetical protein
MVLHDVRDLLREALVDRVVQGVNEFLGGVLDEGAMASVVDESLYRNRKAAKPR